MPRLPRRHLVHEGSYNHCTWRAHNHSFVLGSDEEKRRFLDLVQQTKARFGIRVLSYCLMSTHPHVVVQSQRGQQAFSDFWKVVNHRFARWYNRRTGRTGQVVMDRLASPQIQTGRYQLVAICYGDSNPVRAGMVRSPKDWPWSSYRHYAFGEPNPLVDDSPEYLALGRTGPERRRAYRMLFAASAADDLRVRRRDLVRGPFVGEEWWVQQRVAAAAPPAPS